MSYDKMIAIQAGLEQEKHTSLKYLKNLEFQYLTLMIVPGEFRIKMRELLALLATFLEKEFTKMVSWIENLLESLSLKIKKN